MRRACLKWDVSVDRVGTGEGVQVGEDHTILTLHMQQQQQQTSTYLKYFIQYLFHRARRITQLHTKGYSWSGLEKVREELQKADTQLEG